MVKFEWDDKKAADNVAKHGVSFAEAATAFGDPLSITIDDPGHWVEERRFVLLGQTYSGRLVTVVHAERGQTIRMISARLATKRERKTYEEDPQG